VTSNTTSYPDKLRALGNKVSEFEGFDRISAPKLVTNITLKSEELIAFCPVTGQPDFYSVQVAYRPDKWIVETKTFKLYLGSYRDQGIFAEVLAAKIASDIGVALEAREVIVYLTQKARGGVTTDVIAHWTKKEDGNDLQPG